MRWKHVKHIGIREGAFLMGERRKEMQLSDLLVALSGNTNLFIKLTNETEGDLIIFNAGGYESVESDLGTRVVKTITVVSTNNVNIDLEDATP